MNRAAELDAFQERLERKGWAFTSSYLAGAGKYHWRAHKRAWGLCEFWLRADRDDARAHALQWAELEEAAVNDEGAAERALAVRLRHQPDSRAAE